MSTIGSGKMAAPEFVQTLLPAAEKTELLFHVSYLCLGKFPQLEKIIRANAVEAQTAFFSSETLLLQCASTSCNLTETLFPFLTKALETENAILAIGFLEKARAWIQDIIQEVEEMVKEYGQLNRGVASAASDVNKVKVELDTLNKKLTGEQETLKKNIQVLEQRRTTAHDRFSQNTRDLGQAEKNLRAVVSDIAERNKKYHIAAMAVPLFGLIAHGIQQSVNSSDDRQRIENAKMKVSALQRTRDVLNVEVARAHEALAQEQFKLVTVSTNLGSLPDPIHLPEVQANVAWIQKILLQLKSFWEKTKMLVSDLQHKTFAAEDLMQFLRDSDFKKDFIDSVAMANTAWTVFRIGCKSAVVVFGAKSKDAYKFLETNPSTLSPQDWQKQYNALKQKLDNVYSSAAIDH